MYATQPTLPEHLREGAADDSPCPGEQQPPGKSPGPPHHLRGTQGSRVLEDGGTWDRLPLPSRSTVSGTGARPTTNGSIYQMPITTNSGTPCQELRGPGAAMLNWEALREAMLMLRCTGRASPGKQHLLRLCRQMQGAEGTAGWRQFGCGRGGGVHAGPPPPSLLTSDNSPCLTESQNLPVKWGWWGQRRAQLWGAQREAKTQALTVGEADEARESRLAEVGGAEAGRLPGPETLHCFSRLIGGRASNSNMQVVMRM